MRLGLRLREGNTQAVDVLAVMARDAHRRAVENVELAAKFREQRDDAIRRLYEQGGISYGQIASQVGITRDWVAKIVHGRTPGDRGGS